jgi:ATP-dependent Lon protease
MNTNIMHTITLDQTAMGSANKSAGTAKENKQKFNMNKFQEFLLNQPSNRCAKKEHPACGTSSTNDTKQKQKEEKNNAKEKKPNNTKTKGTPEKFKFVLYEVKPNKRRGRNDDGDDADDEDEEDADEDAYDEDDEDEDYCEEDDEDDEDDDDYVSETEDEDASVSSVDTEDLDDEEFTTEQEEEFEKEIKKDKQYKELQSKYKKSKDPKVKKIISIYKEQLKTEKKKDAIKTKKTQEKYSRIFKRVLKQKSKTTKNDLDYFKEHYTKEEQYDLIKKAKELKKMTIQEKPHRITLLERDIPQIFKAHALKRVQTLRGMDPYDGEYYKIKNWVDTFMKIPFGNYISLPVTINDGQEKCNEFMENACTILDQSVYGLNDAKMQIMQILGQLISNPTSVGTAIAIHGDKGVGKTSIVKDGISKILNRPFAFIPLGGATDSSYLEGHSFTYEGSTWGKIVQILIDSKVMNPVIYFDELDKISDTPKGEEIVSILTHLTDTTQNMEFHDKYFSDIHFDLSKCIFIFSYNDETKINPILRDRMYRIYAKGYDRKEKTVIARDYLLPKIRQEVNFNSNDILLSDEAIGHIIEKYAGQEAGVRNLKRYLEIIHTKLNLCRLMKAGTKMFDNNTVIPLSYPFNVTPEIINKLITQKDQTNNQFISTMYI